MLQYPCLQDMLLMIMFTLTLAIALYRMTGYVCIISLVLSLFCSKDPDHLYFVHISLLLGSSEQAEQTAGTPGMKYRAAHAEVKACSLSTWLETTDQSLKNTAELVETCSLEVIPNLVMLVQCGCCTG